MVLKNYGSLQSLFDYTDDEIRQDDGTQQQLQQLRPLDVSLPSYGDLNQPPIWYSANTLQSIPNRYGYYEATTEAGYEQIRKHNLKCWKSICDILKHK